MIEPPSLQTLPEIASKNGVPLDSLRRLVRTNSQLRALGVQVGSTRGYTPAEQSQIIAAVKERKTKRK